MSEPTSVTGTVITTPRIGRPSSYKPEYCDMLEDYFATRIAICEGRTIEQEAEGKGSSKRNAQRIFAEFPTLEGFAISIGITPFTISDWANRHEAFCQARARAVGSIKHRLINGMLSNEYNTQAAIFVASNLTDMRAKQEITGADGGPLAISAVSPALSALPDDKLQQIQAWLAETEKKQVESGTTDE